MGSERVVTVRARLRTVGGCPTGPRAGPTRRYSGGGMKYAFVRTGLTILLLVADLLGSATQPASAQPPEVVVSLVVEISDSGGWLAFRGSLLANPSDKS